MKVKIDNILNYKDPSGLTKKDLLKMKADLIDSARKLLEIMPKNALYSGINYDGDYTYKYKDAINMIKKDSGDLPKNNAITAMEDRSDAFFILHILLLCSAALSTCAFIVSILIMFMTGETSYPPIMGLTSLLLMIVGMFFDRILLFFNDRKHSSHKNQLFEDICVELENIEKTLELFEELSYLKRRAKKEKKKGKEKLKFTFNSNKDIYFLEVNDDHIGKLWHELKYVNPKIFKKNKKMA